MSTPSTIGRLLRLGLAGLGFAALPTTSFAQDRASDAMLAKVGVWRAWLDSPGGELPFGLRLERAARPRLRVARGRERLHQCGGSPLSAT